MRRILAVQSFVLLSLPVFVWADSSTVSGVSRSLNPAISVNGLFWGQTSPDNDSAERNRFALQEAELQFTAVVDPFWKANLILAMHPEHAHAELGEHEEKAEHAAGGGGLEFDLEEAYLDGQGLPRGLALRLGKFFLPFGKHVPLHTHQFPFAEAPLGVSAFLGEHSLSEVGVQVGVDLPLPWYSDLLFYGVNGDAELFDAENRDLVYGSRLTNFWDLTDSATLELGGSWFRGPDGAHPGEGLALDLFGADLTYKWVSARASKGPALKLTAELVVPNPEEGAGDPRGWYGLAQYRWHRNWWFGITYGQADAGLSGHDEEHHEKQEDHEHHGFADKIHEYKCNLTFAPSEFSALRAEVGYFDDRLGDEDELRFTIQWNFTIGSHPAHLY